ncbi:MAG: hypothetical protein M3N18_05580 [Actinomycetota bacterium]|nr:hypothetical protein [Actinomycetota bacterium]
MSGQERRFRRRNHGGRLIASLGGGVLLLAALLFVFVGCGGSPQEGSQAERPQEGGTPEESTKEAADKGAGGGTTAAGMTNGMGGETTGGPTAGGQTMGETTEGATRQSSGQPYAAIAPPPGATPLTEASGPPEPQGMQVESTAVDQYGQPLAPATRTVPLGQTLVAGAQDPSDGPLKNNRLVAYYGNPLSGYMGVLGETDPQTMMANLKEQTAAYSELDPEHPAIPTIELIASTASREPGASGLYINQLPTELIEQYAQLAEDNGALLLLDVQLGLATVEEEIEILRPFLERPNVHLAIDTEYSVEPGQIPGVDLGNVDGSEIASAIQTLDAIVRENNLPDKMLLVHQFETGIVTNKELIQPTENIEVVLHADGFGGPEAKLTKYDILVRDEATQYGGFKLFYTQDAPLLTPQEVLQLDPAPAVVTYQ